MQEASTRLTKQSTLENHAISLGDHVFYVTSAFDDTSSTTISDLLASIVKKRMHDEILDSDGD